ncbi:GerA spore germination protein [Paenibacillus taihuensis]|uniref:GerA spore germination protein n=1 Tax=Paenibacillus taihuensis TaxID=1156355 RepID=A0A3D9RKF1_9BACL|nr:spore germination protein [Paenibacillus taihuensis]REE80227.1 GerA spore germination protein [Paenibacillus taihuensis]
MRIRSQSKRTEQSITYEWLLDAVRPCGDVEVHSLSYELEDRMDREQIEVLYCTNMVDTQLMQKLLHPEGLGVRIDPEQSPFIQSLDPGVEGKQLFNQLFAGYIIVWKPSNGQFYAMDCTQPPSRSPEESTLELSIKGPRDGFVEEIDTNLALIRKRLRTPKMHAEWFTVGSESQTRLCLISVDGVTSPAVLEEARRRIRGVDIAVLHGAGELEDIIADKTILLVPLIDYIGRPDAVIQSIMNGRFAILVDGSPAALIAPVNVSLLVKSPEDAYQPYYFVVFERTLRLISFFLAGILPGFYLGLLAFNSDQLPFALLATVTMNRIGLPFSPQMELILMMLMFEIFREAGVRLPRAVGQTVTVVGGLIVGDAAIRAGLTSATMLVVTAVTAVSTFTLVNQSLNGSVTVIRFYMMIASSFLGLFGFFISLFSVMLYLCTLESFGMPYLKPLAPFEFKKMLTAVWQLPWKYRAKRNLP